MEIIALIDISCCVGFGLVFGGWSALIIGKFIEKCGSATGKFLARIVDKLKRR